jgi:hypothetical protein
VKNIWIDAILTALCIALVIAIAWVLIVAGYR